MNALEYYKLIRTAVQLKNVKLISINCNNFEGGLKDKQLSLLLNRNVKVISDTQAIIQLHTKIHFEEDGPFSIEIIYQGETKLLDESINRDQFEEYNYNQVVPLLLPYARECVANVLARMNLPIYTIPTMDILESIKQNSLETE
ncbi:hypothetical protein [Bacillus velezensis]|uniref:hypothetical protein n=1 Tax=Bacillus velezensis TaxID=492670 RepID=UPI00333C6E4B